MMFFRKILYLMSMLIFTVAAHAQRTINYGAIASGNLSNLIVESEISYKTMLKPTYAIGAFASMPLNEKFSVQPELKYTNKGAGVDFENGKKGTNTVGYIELPVYVTYNPADKIVVEGGPYIAYLLSAKQKVKGEESVDLKNNLRSMDAGWSLGVGWQLKDEIRLSFRFTQGVTPMLKKHLGTNNKVTSQVIGFSLIYQISK
jgi:outer membrane immunogenic protein